MFQACGVEESYLACVGKILGGELPQPSFGHRVVTASEGFDLKGVSKFRADSMTCKERHFGLCRTLDAEFYDIAIAVAWRVCAFIARICQKGDCSGNVLFRFSAKYRAEGRDGYEYRHDHAMLALLVAKPRSAMFVGMSVVGEGDAALGNPALEHVQYPQDLRLLLGPAGLEIQTVWAMARDYMKRPGLVDLSMSRVRFDNNNNLTDVRALEEAGSVSLVHGGELAKGSEGRKRKASGLDVVIIAEQTESGPPCGLSIPGSASIRQIWGTLGHVSPTG